MIDLLIIMADARRWELMRLKMRLVPGVVVTHPGRMPQDIQGRLLGFVVIDEMAGLTPEEAKQADVLRLWTGGVK
jgi:hypothetical protein